jgi:hypothetical protein
MMMLIASVAPKWERRKNVNAIFTTADVDLQVNTIAHTGNGC